MKAVYCEYCGKRVTDPHRAKRLPVAYCSDDCEYHDGLPPAPLEFSPGAFMELVDEWPP